MPDPAKPEIDYSYSGFQQEQQSFPFPGTPLDNDLAELKRGIDDTIDALKDVRRSDGKLKNGIVTRDSLGPDVVPIGEGMNPLLYDPSGIGADVFSMDNMVEGTNTKIMTAAERAKLAGISDYVQLNRFRFAAVATADAELDTGVEELIAAAMFVYIDGVFQPSGSVEVTDGVITSVGGWPIENGPVNIDVYVPPAIAAPISNEMQAQLDLKAPLASPALTGNPTAPTQDAGNSTTRLATTAFVTGMQIDRTRLYVGTRKSMMLAPQELGAIGDGAHDDTNSLIAWAAACTADNLQPYVPPGLYLCTSQLDFPSGGAIVGAGEGKAIVRFTNASSGGFKCHPDGGADPHGVFSIEHLTMQASALVPKAVDFVLPNDGDFMNDWRGGFRNLEIKGFGSGYFGYGLYERNVAYSGRSRVKYWGSSANPTAESGYYAGVAFYLDTQTVGDDPNNGLSLENVYEGCSAHFCHTGLQARGFPEGIHLHRSNFAFVRRGVDAVAQTATRQPLLNISDNHINAAEWGILADRFNQSFFKGNHIARPGDNFGFGWVGIDLDDSLYAQVVDNLIIPETVHASATGDVIGLRLQGDSYLARIRGAFVGAISGSYKPMTYGIRIETGVQSTRWAADTVFGGTITTPISDDSGNATNQMTGITVQDDGVTVGQVGGISLINFATGTVGQSGGSVTIS